MRAPASRAVAVSLGVVSLESRTRHYDCVLDPCRFPRSASDLRCGAPREGRTHCSAIIRHPRLLVLECGSGVAQRRIGASDPQPQCTPPDLEPGGVLAKSLGSRAAASTLTQYVAIRASFGCISSEEARRSAFPRLARSRISSSVGTPLVGCALRHIGICT